MKLLNSNPRLALLNSNCMKLLNSNSRLALLNSSIVSRLGNLGFEDHNLVFETNLLR